MKGLRIAALRRLGWRARVGALALVAVGALASGRPAAEKAPLGAVSDHVVVISIDGLRPDAINKYELKTLRQLARSGSYSWEAQTIFPSKTLPSHTSMLTGVPPAVHGILWNDDQVGDKGLVQVPTIFELAKRERFTTAAFFSKSKFHHLQKPGSLDYTQAPEGMDKWLATRTVADVKSYLGRARPNLLFVHIGETDYAGHSIGWMSFAYKWAARRADAAVAQVLRSADAAFGSGNYTVIVTADHGGHGRNHGSDDPRDMTIPWIVWGRGVVTGQYLGTGIRTMDTAATVLWLLGVEAPATFAGVPVTGAFTAAVAQAS